MKQSVFASFIFCCIFLNHGNCNILRRQLWIDSNFHRNNPKDSVLFSLRRNATDEADYYGIIGGSAVEIEEFPWTVSLIQNNRPICGGSIISPERVLTAAHCTSVSARSLKIRAGSSLLDSGGQVVYVSKYVKHPKYNGDTIENDISILFLETSLLMSSKIGLIGLPKQGEHLPGGTKLRVAGFGSTGEYGNMSQFLLAGTVPVVEHDRCAKIYQGINQVADSMMCAGLEEGGSGVCFGDSGSALTLGRDIVGIVSWSQGCARPGKPAVYTNVASFTDWISRNM